MVPAVRTQGQSLSGSARRELGLDLSSHPTGALPFFSSAPHTWRGQGKSQELIHP